MAQKTNITSTNTYVKPILSPNETAALLGVSIGTLANWRSQNVGPSYCKLGSKVVYRLDDIMAYIVAHRVFTRNSR